MSLTFNKLSAYLYMYLSLYGCIHSIYVCSHTHAKNVCMHTYYTHANMVCM